MALLVFARITTLLLRARFMSLQRDEVRSVGEFALELSTRSVFSPSLSQILPASPEEINRSVSGGIERTHDVMESLTSQALIGVQYFQLLQRSRILCNRRLQD